MGLISRVSSRTYRKKQKSRTMPASKKFPTRAAWKSNYFDKLKNAIKNHNKFLLVNADNVASLQFAQIRRSCRGQAEIVMGKNTMMKKVIRGLLEEDFETFKDYEKVLPALVPRRLLSSRPCPSRPKSPGVPLKSSATSTCSSPATRSACPKPPF